MTWARNTYLRALDGLAKLDVWQRLLVSVGILGLLISAGLAISRIETLPKQCHNFSEMNNYADEPWRDCTSVDLFEIEFEKGHSDGNHLPIYGISSKEGGADYRKASMTFAYGLAITGFIVLAIWLMRWVFRS